MKLRWRTPPKLRPPARWAPQAAAVLGTAKAGEDRSVRAEISQLKRPHDVRDAFQQGPNTGEDEERVRAFEKELPACPEREYGQQDAADQAHPPEIVKCPFGERLHGPDDPDQQEHEAEDFGEFRER